MKALGVGLGACELAEIEVVRDEDSGAPDLVLHGKAAVLAADRGVTAWHLSLTHTDTVGPRHRHRRLTSRSGGGSAGRDRGDALPEPALLAETGAMTVQVREASVDDIDELMALRREVAGEGRWIGAELPLDEEGDRRTLTESAERGSLFVAEVDGASSACSACTCPSTWWPTSG